MAMPGTFPTKGSSKDDLISPALRVGQPSDAVSLHSTHHSDRFYDEDPAELQSDDLPPMYSDSAETTGQSAPLLPSYPQFAPEDGAPAVHLKDKNNGNECYIDRRLDTDPEYLQQHIEHLARMPPRPYVQVRGTHTQSVKKGDKTERTTFVDFDVKVELTPFLYSDISRQASWSELRTADNFEKVRRGTVFQTRAPGFGGKSTGAVQLETGNTKPDLREWCHRYCASHAGLKTFLLQRHVLGFDEDLVKTKLENLVRATHYRGHLTVTFPIHDESVEIYNEARTNRWRLTWWIQWLFMFTLLFLFTWPYLFFRTARYEVVVADWPFSRRGADGRKQYVTVSEEQWYNMWGRAIQKAVLERRQGVLDQSDLMAADGAAPSLEAAVGQIGNGTVRGLVQAGVSAMNVVNRQFGWGADS